MTETQDIQAVSQPPADEASALTKNGLENIVIREVEYIHALSDRINALIASNDKVIKVYRRYLWTFGLFASFLRGVVTGFGWVIGTTIVVGVFFLFLKSFDSVPIVAEWVSRIIDYLHGKY